MPLALAVLPAPTFLVQAAEPPMGQAEIQRQAALSREDEEEDEEDVEDEE